MIYRSPYPDVDIPDVSLPRLILDAARARGSAVALIDGISGAATTYAELVQGVERTAAGLHARGFRKGEVAALCTPNRPEFAIAFLTIARLGGICTFLNPSYTEEEMAKQLADCQAVIGFTVPELAERLQSAAAGRLRDVFTFGAGGALPFTDLAIDAPPPLVTINPAEDVVALPYSSGTTGRPKGVMLTHRNLVAMQRQMLPVEATSERDVTLCTLPLFHIYGLSVILLLALYRRAMLVLFPRFEMASFLAAIQQYRVTRLPVVPPIIQALLAEPALDQYDLSSVRVVTSGAAPLAPELASMLSQRLNCLVKQGYGMTEISPGGHMHPEDQGTPLPGSVGLLHPNTECRLVDPDSGQDAAAGEAGEIWYRGPQVMKGYLGQPEATAAIITSDGWLRTGDIGRIDEQGYLYVVDRLKELIKYKGFQVAPAELEALLLSHPAIADAAVIPKPDREAGEIPKAFVVRAPDSRIEADEVKAFVAGHVAGYKQLRDVQFVDEIPKSPSGKILRRVLVERERAAPD